jgi:hypothetical protein
MRLLQIAAALFVLMISGAKAQTPDYLDKNLSPRAAKDIDKMDLAELNVLKTALAACPDEIFDDKSLWYPCDVAIQSYRLEYGANARRAIDAVMAVVRQWVRNAHKDFESEEELPNQSSERSKKKIERELKNLTPAAELSLVRDILEEAISARFKELRSAKKMQNAS